MQFPGNRCGQDDPGLFFLQANEIYKIYAQDKRRCLSGLFVAAGDFFKIKTGSRK